jgi:putative beta-lysine N-acetyltransferase
MDDTITEIENSLLQHGKYNDRIYLMKLSRHDDIKNIIHEIEKLAELQKYSKVIAKVPEFAKDKFLKYDYAIEASIPGFYNGFENVYFMGKYFSVLKKFQEVKKVNEILNTARSKDADNIKVELPTGFDYRFCDESDVGLMTDVYKHVFATYPFPIHDSDYIFKTMNENVTYYSILEDDKIIALASAEMDATAQNVEMTDFATLPEYRGNGLAVYLLNWMEDEMHKRDIKTSYTIARAVSYGINIIFAKSGYEYCGTLFNNTNISGDIESMNIWYKNLQ